MSATDLDVGAYIYSRIGWINPWRLQKLVYYAQAWSLAWTGRPLFDDRVEAWDDGPVAPNLHRVNKYERNGFDLPGADLSRLSVDERALIDSVIDFYGRFNKESLIALTHGETPWKEAHMAHRNTEIKQSSMLSFYSTLSAIGGAKPTPPHLESAQFQEHELLERAERLAVTWRSTLERLAS